jgi:hypothetical protein
MDRAGKCSASTRLIPISSKPRSQSASTRRSLRSLKETATTPIEPKSGFEKPLVTLREHREFVIKTIQQIEEGLV